MVYRRVALLPAAVLALAMGVGLAACGSGGSDDDASTPAAPGTTKPVAGGDADTADADRTLFCSTYDQVTEDADWKNVGTRDLDQEKARLDDELVAWKRVVPPQDVAADWNEVLRTFEGLDLALGEALAGGADMYNSLEAAVDTFTNDKDFLAAQARIATFGAGYCGGE